MPPAIIATIEDVVASTGTFSVDSYFFLQAGIHRAAEQVHGKSSRTPEGARHVTGRQLCETLRELAIEHWGMMAPVVLRSLGFHCTRDFGRLVFAFVDAGHWHKQPSDTIEDFDSVYHFRDAFDKQYKLRLPDKVC
jgi:uncharacterized repeat protein (TIGR04138 family)